ncbi:hypothetical protein A2U01_0112354, partial [Trifolium medium]|nr:hypothetical protein [Trifolium medium]
MSDSEHSDVDTRTTTAAIGGSGQPKTTTLKGSKMDFHPAFAVSNIKNHIPILLEMEKDQYG